jgi:hypothetical protein
MINVIISACTWLDWCIIEEVRELIWCELRIGEWYVAGKPCSCHKKNRYS